MSFGPPENVSLVQEFLKTVGGLEELKNSEEKLCDFFEVVYREYWFRMCSRIARFVGDKQTAEDLAQETFLRAYKSLKSLKNPEAFDFWLNKIAVNLIKDHYRKNSRFTFLSSDNLDSITEPLSFIGTEEEILEALKFQKIVNQLPPQEKLCFLLHYLIGYNQEEIAQTLDISGTGVRRLLRKAETQFRSLYYRESHDQEGKR